MWRALQTFARRGNTLQGVGTRAFFSTNTDVGAQLADAEQAADNINLNAESTKLARGVVRARGPIEQAKADTTVGQAEDIFRANTLAGISDKYHIMQRAFDAIRSGAALTPELEEDLKAVYKVTSLMTADAAEIRKAKKKALIEHYQRRPGDTGSTEVQVVLLTEKINNIKFHLTRNVTDKALILPLTKLIVRRRKYLQYLRKERFRTYQIICRDLGVDEDEYWKVGKLPKTKPYYDPSRPKYGRPITDELKRSRYTKPGTKGVEKEIKTTSLIANTYVF